MKAHLIFVTKYRRKILTTEGLEVISSAFDSVAQKMGFEVLEFNGEGEHVHALLEYPPKLSISTIANALKGVSSRRYGQKGLPKPATTQLWSPGYFASSVGGAPLEVLQQYIHNQKPS